MNRRRTKGAAGGDGSSTSAVATDSDRGIKGNPSSSSSLPPPPPPPTSAPPSSIPSAAPSLGSLPADVAAWVRAQCTTDTRSLAIMRMLLGYVVLLVSFERLWEVQALFADTGIFSRSLASKYVLDGGR